jgi:hypothetical protein
MHMRRVQLQITDEQAAHLDRRSSATGKTIAAVILNLIDDQCAADEKQRRIDVALAALERPAFQSGLTDISENHDEYLGQILDEEVERWRRG